MPTSSPIVAGEFRLEGDDGMSSGGVPSIMDSRNTIEIEDPDFMFADDGEIIQFSPRRSVDRTTARTPGATMSSDARTSAWAPKEHMKGHRAGNQVSFTALFHIFSHRDTSHWSCGLASLPLPGLRIQRRTTSLLPPEPTRAHEDVLVCLVFCTSSLSESPVPSHNFRF